MITIIDYGMGNLGSVFNMFKKIGVVSKITSDLEEIKSAKKLLLPGVGSFDKAMEDSWAKKDEWEAMGIRAHKQACEYFGNDPVSRLLEDIVEMYKDNK